ncbi:hypothetical protein BCR12_02495 [Limnothrix sp. P13C2]|nr:hypothetical protein BCR12_02495 [Limnothrix sp. P13C2]
MPVSPKSRAGHRPRHQGRFAQSAITWGNAINFINTPGKLASVTGGNLEEKLWKGFSMPKARNRQYGETKKERILTLTQTAWDALEAQGRSLGVSRSELIEQFARGLLGGDLSRELTGKRLAT